MVTMAQSAANWRHSHGSHAFTHARTARQLQPHARGAKHQLSACWGFSCCRNPPNSGMDYRICIVRTYVIILVRACTHGENIHVSWRDRKLSVFHTFTKKYDDAFQTNHMVISTKSIKITPKTILRATLLTFLSFVPRHQ